MKLFKSNMVDSVTLALNKVSLGNSSSSDSDDSVVKILVDNRELLCSRQLLVQHSKYFRAYFAFEEDQKLSENPVTNDKDRTVIRLKGGLDFNSAKIILDSIQDGIHKIKLDEDNVQSVLQASAFLQCQLVERACTDFMLNNLSLSNAFSVFNLGLGCGAAYLAEAAETFILDQVRSLRLNSLTSVMDFLHMDLNKLKEALAVIENNYVSYCTACGWVAYDLPERSQYLEELLKDVIVEIISPDALTFDGLEDHPLVMEAVSKAVAYEALPLRGKINHWEKITPSRDKSLSKWPKLGIVCSTGNNSSLIAYRFDL